MPAIERTIELNPGVADRLSGRVLHWGDEEAAAQLLATGRRHHPVSVILCSDLLYGDGAPAGGGEGSEDSGEAGAEEEEEQVIGAAEALAITLSTVVRSSRAASSECVILSCHERRWAGDKGAFFFETMARRGFQAEAVDPGDIDERYAGDCGIAFSRIRLPL